MNIAQGDLGARLLPILREHQGGVLKTDIDGTALEINAQGGVQLGRVYLGSRKTLLHLSPEKLKERLTGIHVGRANLDHELASLLKSGARFSIQNANDNQALANYISNHFDQTEFDLQDGKEISPEHRQEIKAHYSQKETVISSKSKGKKNQTIPKTVFKLKLKSTPKGYEVFLYIPTYVVLGSRFDIYYPIGKFQRLEGLKKFMKGKELEFKFYDPEIKRVGNLQYAISTILSDVKGGCDYGKVIEPKPESYFERIKLSEQLRNEEELLKQDIASVIASLIKNGSYQDKATFLRELEAAKWEPERIAKLKEEVLSKQSLPARIILWTLLKFPS